MGRQWTNRERKLDREIKSDRIWKDGVSDMEKDIKRDRKTFQRDTR